MAMAEPHFATLDDDLPRTVRREKEARERASIGRAARERSEPDVAGLLGPRVRPEPINPDDGAIPGVTVTRFQVPFRHLVAFFLKATLAAIPALILLMVILWGLGAAAERFFPALVKMRILIHFPG